MAADDSLRNNLPMLLQRLYLPSLSHRIGVVILLNDIHGTMGGRMILKV